MYWQDVGNEDARLEKEYEFGFIGEGENPVLNECSVEKLNKQARNQFLRKE